MTLGQVFAGFHGVIRRSRKRLEALREGFRVGVLDPTPNCPTGQVADFQITAEYDDKTAIHDLAVQSDVLTYEFENVDAGAIDEVRGITATPQAPTCCA